MRSRTAPAVPPRASARPARGRRCRPSGRERPESPRLISRGKRILELRELDLDLPLVGAGASRERCPRISCERSITLRSVASAIAPRLRRREVLVHDDEVGWEPERPDEEVLEPTGAHERPGSNEARRWRIRSTTARSEERASSSAPDSDASARPACRASSRAPRMARPEVPARRVRSRRRSNSSRAPDHREEVVVHEARGRGGKSR